MYFHPRKYLFSQKPCLNLNFRSTINQPWQINSHCISLIGWGILNKIIGQKFVVFNIKSSGFNSCMSFWLSQMIVIVLEKIRLFINILKLLEGLLPFFFFFFFFIIFFICFLIIFFVVLSILIVLR